MALSTCAEGSAALEVQQISSMLCPTHYLEITGRDGTTNSGLLDFLRANDLLLQWLVKQHWSQNKFFFFFKKKNCAEFNLSLNGKPLSRNTQAPKR